MGGWIEKFGARLTKGPEIENSARDRDCTTNDARNYGTILPWHMVGKKENFTPARYTVFSTALVQYHHQTVSSCGPCPWSLAK